MAAHGTRSGYTGGCRCDACAQANRDYQRSYMAARYVQASEDTFHGYRRNDGTLQHKITTGRYGRPPKWDTRG